MKVPVSAQTSSWDSSRCASQGTTVSLCGQVYKVVLCAPHLILARQISSHHSGILGRVHSAQCDVKRQGCQVDETQIMILHYWCLSSQGGMAD